MSGKATVKVEKGKLPNPQTTEERELEEWARKLASQPVNQIGTTTATRPMGITSGGGLQQTTLNSFVGITSNASNSAVSTVSSEGGVNIPANQGFDLDSAIGRFTWATFDDEEKFVPCIFRKGDKYCCIRMVEISIIRELLAALPPDLYDCTNLTSHHATAPEARLLTHINTWHCDGFYGTDPFTTNDLVVSLSDVEKFYSYLKFAFHVLSTGGDNPSKDFSKCGFVKVNSDNLIPFTVLPNDEKGVPLFYFEGQTDILKEKAKPLSGWELAYLKVCCKVQGVRKDLISGQTLQIVTISDLKSYFPKRTVFVENCWPVVKSKGKSLLGKSDSTRSLQSSANSKVSVDKWTKNTPYIYANQTTASTFTTSSTSSTTTTATNCKKLTASASATTVISKMGTTISPVNNNVLTTQNPGNPGSKSRDPCSNPEVLAKLTLLTPPKDKDMSRLKNISEDLSGRQEGAYVVRLIIVEKQMMHCINMKPFKQDGYLLVLSEFMNHFFPSVSIYPTAVSVLESSGVTTFLPNMSQIRALNDFGFKIQHHWELPLVLAVEVTQVMSKLKNFFRPRNTPNMAHDRNLTKAPSNGYAVMPSNSLHYGGKR